MSEWLITAIAGLLTVGQVYMLTRGLTVAVTYFMVVAPLGYFSVWSFGTWSPERLCGVPLILAAFMGSERGHLRGLRQSYGVFFLYGVVLTALAAPFWPSQAIEGASSVYRELRWVIQLVNWTVMLGTGAVIGVTLSRPGALDGVRKWLSIAAIILCAYAVYQYLGYQLNLPITGIRRPVEGIGADRGGDQLALQLVAGRLWLRPGSLVGEPKMLGALCVFWLAMVFTTLLDEHATGRRLAYFALPGVLTALVLSLSTSAWGGALACLALTALVSLRDRRAAFRWLMVLTFVGVLAGAFWSRQDGGAPQATEEIYEARWRGRLENEGAVGDLAEQVALHILTDRPALAVLGTGLGGIAAFIAERLGGGQRFVLYPNNGLLAFVCDIGVVGLLLLAWTCRAGFRHLWRPAASSTSRSLALMGTASLLQVFIFPQPWLVSFALGCLLAADQASMQGAR